MNITPRERSLRRARRTRYHLKLHNKKNLMRLTIFRSHRHIYAQVIDDMKGITVAHASDMELKNEIKNTKRDRAHLVGQALGKKLAELCINILIFDRGPYQFAGRVKAFVEGLKKEHITI